MSWDADEIIWIKVMDNLMTMMFGGDFLLYEYDEKKICHVETDCRPTFVYSREDWAAEYDLMVKMDRYLILLTAQKSDVKDKNST